MGSMTRPDHGARGAGTPLCHTGLRDGSSRRIPLIQPKAVRFLERHGAAAEVAGLAQRYETVVGPHGNTYGRDHNRLPTLMLLLGLHAAFTCLHSV